MKMKTKKVGMKNWVVLLIVLLLAFSFSFFGYHTYDLFVTDSDAYRANLFDSISQKTSSLLIELNDFPRDEGDDVLYLSRIGGLQDFLNTDGSSDALAQEVSDEFLTFLGVGSAYSQLRYIDENGQERVRVEYDGEKYNSASVGEMVNKRNRYYFDETMKLDFGEVYVSKLDLNIEKDVLENRGSKENPEYVPVIRYGTPVFNDAGEARGIVISNVYADYFLEDIRRQASVGDFSFMMDNDGYYLAHPNRSKEFSFMFGGKYNVFVDYPEYADELLTSFDERILDTEDKVFVLRYIYPTVGTFEAYQGALKIHGDDPEQEYYWVLVSVSEKTHVNSVLSKMEKEMIFSILLAFLVFVAVLVLLIMLRVMNGHKRYS
jgi:hypothetical protein